MLEKVFPWIVFFGGLLQPACLQRLFLRAGPRLSSVANSLWDSCRLLRSLRQVLVEAPQRFRKPPCEAGRFCGSFSLFRDSLVPRRCETRKVNRRSVSGSSLLGSKWNIPAGLRANDLSCASTLGPLAAVPGRSQGPPDFSERELLCFWRQSVVAARQVSPSLAVRPSARGPCPAGQFRQLKRRSKRALHRHSF